MDVGFPSLSQTIAKTMAPVPVGFKAIVTPNPSTRWGWEQRAKTARMVMGIGGGRFTSSDESGGLVPALTSIERILLGID